MVFFSRASKRGKALPTDTPCLVIGSALHSTRRFFSFFSRELLCSTRNSFAKPSFSLQVRCVFSFIFSSHFLVRAFLKFPSFRARASPSAAPFFFCQTCRASSFSAFSTFVSKNSCILSASPCVCVYVHCAHPGIFSLISSHGQRNLYTKFLFP